MTDTPGPLDDLPGDLMIWALVVTELLVLGAGLLAFLAVWLTDPSGFAAAQDQLHQAGVGINALIVALLAGRWRPVAGQSLWRARLWLAIWAGLWLLHGTLIGVSSAP